MRGFDVEDKLVTNTEINNVTETLSSKTRILWTGRDARTVDYSIGEKMVVVIYPRAIKGTAGSIKFDVLCGQAIVTATDSVKLNVSAQTGAGTRFDEVTTRTVTLANVGDNKLHAFGYPIQLVLPERSLRYQYLALRWKGTGLSSAISLTVDAYFGGQDVLVPEFKPIPKHVGPA